MESDASCIKHPNAISPPDKFHFNYGFAINIKFGRVIHQIPLVNYPLGYNLKHKNKHILRPV